jgi:hypothetical protein
MSSSLSNCALTFRSEQVLWETLRVLKFLCPGRAQTAIISPQRFLNAWNSIAQSSEHLAAGFSVG